MANQLDKYGIKEIYATRVGGREWFMADNEDDILHDSRAGGDLGDDLKSGGNETDGFMVNDNNQVRLNISPTKELVGAGNVGLDQSTAKGRGYMISTSDWDIAGIEMTARIKCTNHDTDDSRFILKGPTGTHHSNTDDCSGSSYGARFFLADTGSDAHTTEWFKEQWHVHYVTRNNSQKDTGQGHIFNKWVVCKYVVYLVKDSSGKLANVKMEAWLNANNDGVTWVKVNETTDTGGWNDGNGAKDCSADRSDEIMTWDAPHMIFRWDGPIIKFKDLSVREIDPSRLASDTGSNEPPEPPSTGTVSRDYVFRWNLIDFPIDACSLGQAVTTFTNVYDVTDDGSQSNLHKERYRVGILCNGSASKLIGKKPRRIILRLSRTGSPPSGNVTVVIRKQEDDESAAVTFAWTGGTLDAAALATSKTDYTFENLTSNYVLKAGDRILVEYSGNTVDTTNEVNVFRSSDDPFDGAFTCGIKFDAGGVPPASYSSPAITVDYAWKIYEATGDTT